MPLSKSGKYKGKLQWYNIPFPTNTATSSWIRITAMLLRFLTQQRHKIRLAIKFVTCEYVRNNIFVYSHKTQLCTIKYVYYTFYNDMFRPSTAIIRLYMKTSSIYTIDHRSSMWMGWVGGYFVRSRLGLGCADQLACYRVWYYSQ